MKLRIGLTVLLAGLLTFLASPAAYAANVHWYSGNRASDFDGSYNWSCDYDEDIGEYCQANLQGYVSDLWHGDNYGAAVKVSYWKYRDGAWSWQGWHTIAYTSPNQYDYFIDRWWFGVRNLHVQVCNRNASTGYVGTCTTH